jgi:TorA maturation chaperone TorD
MQQESNAELLDALAEVVENPDPHPAILEILELEWTRDGFTELFDFDLPPFASYYLTIGPVLGGEPVGYLRGLLSAYLPPELQPSQPDSLALLLRLLALLLRQRSEDRARVIFYEALSPWLGNYARAILSFAPPGLTRIGLLLDEVYQDWSKTIPSALSLPYLLRSAPEPLKMMDRETVLDSLLSPVASGLILPRSELIRITHRHGLGIRPGGRRFSFQSLLDTSPSETLRAILDSVATQLNWYRSIDSPIALWWHQRLTNTQSSVGEMLNGNTEWADLQH